MFNEYKTCYSCKTTRDQVGRPVDSIVPISLCRERSSLHHVLRGYKDPDTYGLTSSTRRTHATLVAAIFDRFLKLHEGCILDETGSEAIEAIIPVPPTKNRGGRRPLEEALSAVATLSDRLRPVLEVESPTRPNRASDTAFSVVRDHGLQGKTVLLADDALTSGATIQSAGSALQRAGVNVVVAVVIGRFVKFNEYGFDQERWDNHRAANPFTFDSCCLSEHLPM